MRLRIPRKPLRVHQIFSSSCPKPQIHGPDDFIQAPGGLTRGLGDLPGRRLDLDPGQGCIKPLSWIKPSMVEDELSGHLLS
jgi:hypothetical protein